MPRLAADSSTPHAPKLLPALLPARPLACPARLPAHLFACLQDATIFLRAHDKTDNQVDPSAHPASGIKSASQRAPSATHAAARRLAAAERLLL